MQFWRGVIRLTKFSRCIVSGILLPISLLVSGAEGLSIADAAAVPECQTDYLALEGNLVLNPKIECDNNLDDLPDNWRTANTRAGYQTYWGRADQSGGFLEVQNSGLSPTTSSNWWVQDIAEIKPLTWYELSVSFASSDLAPLLDQTGAILSDNMYNGLYVKQVSASGQGLWTNQNSPYLHHRGFEFDDWDETNWVYRNYKSSWNEPWYTTRTYMRTDAQARRAQIGLQMYSRGTLRIDNVSFREVPGNFDPSQDADVQDPPPAFVQIDGKNFFPIGIRFPEISRLGQLAEVGFNTVVLSGITQQWHNALTASQLRGIVGLANVSHQTTGDHFWRQDPNHLIPYAGAQRIRAVVDQSVLFPSLLGFELADETNVHPYVLGSYLPEISAVRRVADYIRTRAPQALVNIELHPSTYTDAVEDLGKYLEPIDSSYYTQNAFCSLPGPGGSVRLLTSGQLIRRARHLAPLKPAFAFGFGAYDWSGWDCKDYYSTITPLSIQRFQIWYALINGATGVLFYGNPAPSSAGQLERYHWEQVKTLTREIAALRDVLEADAFSKDWSVNDSRVEALMKPHGEVVYLFAANSHHEALRDIHFSFPFSVKSAYALNESSASEVCASCRRELEVSSDGSGFRDDFLQQKAREFSSDPDSPGYAVHLYELSINSAPIITLPGQAEGRENQEILIQVSASDPDQDSLAVNAFNLPPGASFQDRTLRWTPASGQAGRWSIGFKASDGKLTTEAAIDLAILPAAIPTLKFTQVKLRGRSNKTHLLALVTADNLPATVSAVLRLGKREITVPLYPLRKKGSATIYRTKKPLKSLARLSRRYLIVTISAQVSPDQAVSATYKLKLRTK